jgi:hypothetical protein
MALGTRLSELADIADAAVALQPAAELAVAQCGASGTVPDTVALELGRLSHTYSLIYERARHLPVDAELVGARTELCRLLSYHLHMLRDAGDLAFSGRPDARSEPFRRELARGLGPYATELITLAAQFRQQATRPVRSVPDDWGAPGEFLLDDIDLSPDGP